MYFSALWPVCLTGENEVLLKTGHTYVCLQKDLILVKARTMAESIKSWTFPAAPKRPYYWLHVSNMCRYFFCVGYVSGTVYIHPGKRWCKGACRAEPDLHSQSHSVSEGVRMSIYRISERKKCYVVKLLIVVFSHCSLTIFTYFQRAARTTSCLIDNYHMLGIKTYTRFQQNCLCKNL